MGMYQRARMTRHAGAIATPSRARWKNAFVMPGSGAPPLGSAANPLPAPAAAPPPAPTPVPPPTMPDLFNPFTLMQQRMKAGNQARQSGRLSTMLTQAMPRPLAAGMDYAATKLGG
jgi:hypothetical protein